MNRELLTTLLYEAKPSRKVTQPADFRQDGQCHVCMQEAFGRCREEHPDWFTPRAGKVAAKHMKAVAAYLREQTPVTACLVFTEYEWEDYDVVPCEVGWCVRHVIEFLRESGVPCEASAPVCGPPSS